MFLQSDNGVLSLKKAEMIPIEPATDNAGEGNIIFFLTLNTFPIGSEKY